MNRQPIPRVAPPPKYWNAYYRSCAGQPYVDDWFAGYDAGFEMGSDSGVSRFREVFLNRTGDPGPSHYGQAAQGNGSANVTGAIDQQGGNMPIPDPSSYGRRY